jgi:hypothetical protein
MYPRYRVEAVTAGIDAFLLKGSPTEVLQNTILAKGQDLPGCTTHW